MSLIREDVLATIMYKKMAILVHMLLRAVPFFSSIFLFFSVALLGAVSKATEKERKVDEWILLSFTISHELQFNYILNLTQAIPHKLN